MKSIEHCQLLVHSVNKIWLVLLPTQGKIKRCQTDYFRMYLKILRRTPWVYNIWVTFDHVSLRPVATSTGQNDFSSNSCSTSSSSKQASGQQARWSHSLQDMETSPVDSDATCPPLKQSGEKQRVGVSPSQAICMESAEIDAGNLCMGSVCCQSLHN